MPELVLPAVLPAEAAVFAPSHVHRLQTSMLLELQVPRGQLPFWRRAP